MHGDTVVAAGIKLIAVPTSFGAGRSCSCPMEEPCSKRMRLGSINGCLISDLLSNIRESSKKLLQELLPSMAEAHKSMNWSLQLQYIDPYLNPDLKVLKQNIEKDLKTELVALCVWLLFSNTAPDNVKGGACRALEFIISSFDKDPYMSKDLFDEAKMIEKDLVVEALCSKNMDVQTQVCRALHFSLSCFKRQGLMFGDVIQYKLIQLAHNPESPDSIVACALESIVYIASARMGTMKFIIDAEIKCKWLGKILMTAKDESILTHACWAITYSLVSNCDDQLWQMKSKMLFMPDIIPWSFTKNLQLKKAAAFAMSAAINNASPDMIEELVEFGCLEALFECAMDLMSTMAIYYILDAISNILKAGDESESQSESQSESESESESEDEGEGEGEGEVVKDNKYARMIDGYLMGWEVLTYENAFCRSTAAFEAKEILRNYRPEYLEKYARI